MLIHLENPIQATILVTHTVVDIRRIHGTTETKNLDYWENWCREVR